RDPHAVAEPPGWFRCRRPILESNLARLIELARMNPENPLAVWRIGGRSAVLNCHGQDETVVVVGVLPDQVDPAGSERHPDRRHAEPGPEPIPGRGSAPS